MPKRKRSEIEDTIDKIEDRALRIKASRLQAKIDQGNKSLKDALQLARGFERQKMGRRQKKASNEPHTLLRLREEVIVLKELDVASTAHDHLFKQLVKTKRIRESAAFIALYGENPKTGAPKSKAEANVLGRLFKANPVMEVLPGILEGIKQVLSLDDNKSANGRKAQIEMASGQERQIDAQDIHSSTADKKLGDFSDGDLDEEVKGLPDSDSDSNLDEAEIALYNDRFAASSENEGSHTDALDPMEISDIEDANLDQAASTTLSPGTDPDEERTPITQPDHPIPPQPSKNPSDTAFLPSLSMGGYYSGSESDDDDNDTYDQKRGPAVPKPRNNRRGQRERQRLAELKYGRNAKHLQKHPSRGNESRDSGWDAKRGAVEGFGHGGRQRQFGKGRLARDKGPTGANADAVAGIRTAKNHKPAAKKGDVSLHPSWEAAKKKKQENSTVAFAGKKVTFD